MASSVDDDERLAALYTLPDMVQSLKMALGRCRKTQTALAHMGEAYFVKHGCTQTDESQRLVSRLLTKPASGGLASLRGSTYEPEYASPLRSLRPCWTAFLNSLRGMLLPVETWNPVRVQYRASLCQHTVSLWSGWTRVSHQRHRIQTHFPRAVWPRTSPHPHVSTTRRFRDRQWDRP